MKPKSDSCSWPKQLSVLPTAASLFVSACTTLGPSPAAPLRGAETPATWSAPLPDPVRANPVQIWWQSQGQQGEPELPQLIEAALAVSPDVAAASARIEQAKALLTGAEGALRPSVMGTASMNRMHAPLYNGTYVQNQAGVQISWELDLAALKGSYTSAAQAQLEGAGADVHAAQILVAAEVAELYHASRICQRQSALASADVGSHERAAQWVTQAQEHGLASAAELATARANASDSRARLLQIQASCQGQIKAQVALTGLSEARLRQILQPVWGRADPPVPFAIESIPARTVAQRPDVYAAERRVLQAKAKVLQAQAARLPRLSLDGFIGRGNFVYGGKSTNAPTWTFGPLAVNLPLFDGGRGAAHQRAAQAEVTAAIRSYQGRVRQGVREVEEALVSLDSAERRWLESRVQAQQAHLRLQINQRLMKQGLISGLELEETKRQDRASEFNALALDLERQRAWITLYRAVGGGFEPASPTA